MLNSFAFLQFTLNMAQDYLMVIIVVLMMIIIIMSLKI